MSMSDVAYAESEDRRPTNREAVRDYLIGQLGSWVPGHELERVGGTEATRRVREIRKALRARQPQRFDVECSRVDGAWSYRMVAL